MATSFVTRANVAPDAVNGDGHRKMTISLEDGSVSLTVPYAPSAITYASLGRTWVQINRAGRRPILAPQDPPLPTMNYDIMFGGIDVDVDMEAELGLLTQLASSDRRVVVSYGPAEAGLWRITQCSVTSVRRHAVTQAIVQATATLEFTQASDATPAVGPVSGGHNGGGGGGGGGNDHERTYTVRKGDTLHTIAVKFYDNPRKWRLIADANKIRHPKKDRKLKVGRKLVIPKLKKKK